MKNTKTTSVLLIFFLFGSFLFSCSKSDQIKPNGKLQLQFKTANNVLGLATNTSATTTNLIWDEGFMNVSSVHLENTSGEIEAKEEKESKKDIEGKDTLSTINLFVPNQNILNVDVAAGTYTNVKVRVELDQTLTAPALYLKGKFTDSKGSLIPMELSLKDTGSNTNSNNHEKDKADEHDDHEFELLSANE